MIFSIAINPSATVVACTSDKGTLHIFDIPDASGRAQQAHAKEPSQLDNDDADSFDDYASHLGDGSPTQAPNRWGLLAKLPGMPQSFRDIVSVAKVPFWMGDQPGSNAALVEEARQLGLPRLPKGILQWTDNSNLVVVGAGSDARWELFELGMGREGDRVLSRIGWKQL